MRISDWSSDVCSSDLRGVGNGISMIIFAGIVAGFPPALGATAQLVSEGSIGGFTVIAVLGLVALVTWGGVFFESAQRRIPIHHAGRQQRSEESRVGEECGGQCQSRR